MGKFQNIIAIWSGFLGTIPANWQLCDGTNDTPDLRDRYVQGSQGSYAIGDTGGNANHSHTFTEDGHWHTNFRFWDVDWPGVYHDDTDIAFDSGTTDIRVNLPIYYALAFIMRMS